MKVDCEQLLKLAAIIKAAKKARFAYSKAFPHYRRSLVNQYSESPTKAGLKRGLGTGALGAILGALIAKLVGGTKRTTLGGATVGGLLGGGAGYISGKRQAQSDKSRLLALRRLGINTPAELELLMNNPKLLQTKGLLEQGKTL